MALLIPLFPSAALLITLSHWFSSLAFLILLSMSLLPRSILIKGRVSKSVEDSGLMIFESVEEPDPRLRSILIIGRVSEPVEELEPGLRWILTKGRVSESLKDLGLGRT